MSGIVLLALRILLTLGLYAFLAYALLLVRQQLRSQAFLVEARKVPPINLQIQRRRGRALLRRFTIPQVTIGRDPSCECSLEDATVSARHARLAFHHGQWWCEDLGSTNGTSLNGENLATAAVLVNEDVIACGDAQIRIGLPGDPLPIENSADHERHAKKKEKRDET